MPTADDAVLALLAFVLRSRKVVQVYTVRSCMKDLASVYTRVSQASRISESALSTGLRVETDTHGTAMRKSVRSYKSYKRVSVP